MGESNNLAARSEWYHGLRVIGRRLHIFIVVISSLLCATMLGLWLHGRGRVERWYFRPSRSFVIQPPDPTQPANWCVQWEIRWSDDGNLVIARQVEPVIFRRPFRAGFYSIPTNDKRWNPLPRLRPAATPFMAGENPGGEPRGMVLPRSKPTTSVQFIGLEYSGNEQDFAQFADGSWGSNAGSHYLYLPLLYLCILFSIVPALFYWRSRRDVSRSRLKAPADSAPLT